METTKFVRIQSTISILVTPGLQASDYTDEKKAVANKLVIKPRWQEGSIQIKQGTHYYPAEIVKWNTVKQLAKQNIITIGETVSQVPTEQEKETTDRTVAFEKGQKAMNVDVEQKRQPKKLNEI